MKKSRNIAEPERRGILKALWRSGARGVYSAALIVLLILIWQLVCSLGLVSDFLLPSPLRVAGAFVSEFPVLMGHSVTTLFEAFTGLFLALALGFVLALLMDTFDPLYRALYPILVLTQTIPSIAIAPLLVLWMGYAYAPKIALVVITCFFPLTIGFLDGFKSVDEDTLNLLRALGAGPAQRFYHVKLPMALPSFFAGLKIAVSYAVVGAVIAEWLGGTSGLGVYMTRVRKSYSYDKMFAVILLVSLISILLMVLVRLLQRRSMPYAQAEE